MSKEKEKDQLFSEIADSCKRLQKDHEQSVLFLVGDTKSKACILFGSSKTISMILGSELVENEELLETVEDTVKMVKMYKGLNEIKNS